MASNERRQRNNRRKKPSPRVSPVTAATKSGRLSIDLTPPPSRWQRRHSHDRGTDQRSEFQRDRDRLLYCSAFRRLAGVTQVVHVAEGHIFHNRLTHSLKVAQTGRRIAEFLIKEWPDTANDVGIDPDVVETASLAHDLGHPPFGHIAEEELDSELRMREVPDGFEGNAQSFRIVTQVAVRNEQHPGLNLTRASLNAILKYPWARQVDGKQFRKWGFYFSEKEDFEFARALSAPNDQRQSAEAAIMDWADDVAYSVHDVEDFYRAGILPLDRLLNGTEEREEFISYIFDYWEKNKITPAGMKDKNKARSFFEKLSYWSEELARPFQATRKQKAGLNFFSALLIRRYVTGQKGIPAISIENQPGKPFIRIEPELRAEVDLLKGLMRYYVYFNPALVGQQYGQRRVVKELFKILSEAAEHNSPHSGIIPSPFRETLNGISGYAQRERARLVADIIGSLTEQQAIAMHQRLMGIAPGSVRDLIVN